MPSRIDEPGVLYTNNGTENSPAVLGTVTVDPKYISCADGFFTFPTQTLLQVTPDSGEGQTTAFEPGQNLDAYTSFVDTSVMDARRQARRSTIAGGFGDKKASNNDPKAFTYEFDDNTFPNIPLIQPRLNSVEEWTITNFNNDEPSDAHPRQRLSGDGRSSIRSSAPPPGCSRGVSTTSNVPAAG